MLKGLDINAHILISTYNATLKGDHISAWKIAKTFNWKDKPIHLTKVLESRYYIKKTVLITKRIRAMAKEGIVEIKKEDGRLHFQILGEKVIDSYKFPEGYKPVLVIKSDIGKRIIFEI